MGFLAFPQIDVKAVRVGRARELQVWYGGRAFDRAGRGVIPASVVGGHLSRASRSRALQRGEGVFWTRAGRKLFLFGEARVAQALEITRVSTAYRAPSAWLREPGWCKTCAQIFLAGLAGLRDGRPTAVATMAQLAGRSTRTIRTWLARTQWGRIVNVALLEQISEAGDGRHMNRRSLDGRIMQIEFAGGVWLAERLPNSLQIRHQRVQRRAALHWVNARLSSHQGDTGQQSQCYVMPGRRRPHDRLHPTAQDEAYQFHTRLQAPEPMQLWLPPRSPEIRVKFLQHSLAGDRERPRAARSAQYGASAQEVTRDVAL